MRLVRLSQQGDKDATETLVNENTPLIKSVLKRYIGKHVEYDDLFQISSIGLLKAVKNFSPEYDVRFSTYAVPMILGEIKRFMRDDGYLKVSRSLKSLANKITKYVDERQKCGDEPTVEQIAEHFNVDVSEVAFAMDSAKMPVSLYEQTTDKDGKKTELIEKVPSEDDKKLVDRVILKDMLQKLSPREQKVIVLRYYRDMTQSEIAQKLGVSQVQVSRMENKVLEKLKSFYDEN